MSRAAQLLRRASLFLFFAVLVAGAFTARVIMEGESELAASDAAFDAGKLDSALDHARRSATLYAPGAPHVERAYERLEALAIGAEAAGQAKVAFLAWQAMRSAALESRHVWLPRAAELSRANQNLARLEALGREQSDDDRAQARTRALGRLTSDSAPAPQWIAVLGLGFLLALVGLALFAVQGVDRTGKLSLRRARLGAALFVIGAACWALAAYQA